MTGHTGDGGINGSGIYRVSLVSFPVYFTRDAREEATRDGPPPIDPIDGEQLCELLEEERLGVKTTEERIERVEILESFFDELG